jgi:hypothetical protein
MECRLVILPETNQQSEIDNQQSIRPTRYREVDLMGPLLTLINLHQLLIGETTWRKS